MSGKQSFVTLSELNELIKNAIIDYFPQPVWLVAELFSMNIHKSGHCYLELAEKSDKTQKLMAKSKAVIWAYQFNLLRTYFEQSTGMEFAEGIKVLLKVTPNFHEQYGFSLIISDIDPTYTMGDLARQRQQTIQSLKDAGAFDLNKEQFLSYLPKKLAVISSATAAGYEDFMKQMANVIEQFNISVCLFPALLQGQGCPESIIGVVEEIYDRKEEFDAVILIRGGGAKSDLSCFDDYNLALNICYFPLPVITGIGHERDESVVDLVAHTRLKTPTAVAQFIIDRFNDAEAVVFQYQEQLISLIKAKMHLARLDLAKYDSMLFRRTYDRLSIEKNGLLKVENRLKNKVSDFLMQQKIEVRQIEKSLAKECLSLTKSKLQNLNLVQSKFKDLFFLLMSNAKKELQFLEKKAELQNPENLLRKGYSITSQNGSIITSVNQIDINTEMQTTLPDGKIISQPGKILNK